MSPVMEMLAPTGGTYHLGGAMEVSSLSKDLRMTFPLNKVTEYKLLI